MCESKVYIQPIALTGRFLSHRNSFINGFLLPFLPEGTNPNPTTTIERRPLSGKERVRITRANFQIVFLAFNQVGIHSTNFFRGDIEEEFARFGVSQVNDQLLVDEEIS